MKQCSVISYTTPPNKNNPLKITSKWPSRRSYLLTGATQFLAKVMVIEIIHWLVVLNGKKGHAVMLTVEFFQDRSVNRAPMSYMYMHGARVFNIKSPNTGGK